MKNLLLILVMFISSIAFAQECFPDCPEPVVFDFACEVFDCDDLYWAHETDITWIGANGTEQNGKIYSSNPYYGTIFRSNGHNPASPGDYTVLNTSILRRADDTIYSSPAGFILSVGGGAGGSITCIQPIN